MILKIELKGGLCNKLFCLFSACDIAIKNGYLIAEPEFGWNKKIKFSEIYDIDYFNIKMKEYTCHSQLMMNNNQYKLKQFFIKTIKINANELWEYSEKILETQRSSRKIDDSSSILIVLKSLKLNKKNYSFFLKNVPNNKYISLQLRIESDWIKYSSKKKSIDGESYIVDLPDIIKLVKPFIHNEELFITTGENHQNVKNEFDKAGMLSNYFYNPKLEYEVNAAINFEICLNSTKFIGLSRSSYSNLISLKRALNNNDNSYIYNYRHQIKKRIDKGLQPKAINSIEMFTRIN